MLNESHLAYSNPRPAPYTRPDERYVVLKFAPDKLGNPNGPGKYHVLVVDGGRNVIGWQYPLRFNEEATARAEANKIWALLRKSNAERLARAEADKQEEEARLAAWVVATEQAEAQPGWNDLSFSQRRARVEQLLPA